ncbi:hypothetical protein [Cohnella mopanensis]|uniref:hypothetical protein n=1 Tax=Cohnella mopanensis TaxID=2911966 RepID=UPI001EF8C6A8|nr:hypothetical protein [Cohnella mopanensis]
MLIQEYAALKIWESAQQLRELQYPSRADGLKTDTVTANSGLWRITLLLLTRLP